MTKYPVVELGEICDEIYRYPSFYGMEHFSVGVPVIRGEHIDEWGNVSQNWSDFWFVSEEVSNQFPRTILREGDLVFTVRGTIGKVGLITKPHDGAQLSPNLIRFSPKREKVDSIFLWYFLQSIKETAAADIQNEVTIASVRASDLSELKIPLPPLTEQKRIASLLARADRLRHLRRTAHDLGESLLQSVFLEMFGDPKTNPMGWKKAKLGDVVVSIQDGPHVSPEYTETGVPFLSTRNVRPGQLIWEDMKYISEENAQAFWKRKGSKPEKGDILYTKGGTTGYAKVVDFDRQVAVWVHIAVLKLRHNLVNPLWLESMLNSEYCYKQSQELTFGIVNRDFGILRMPRVEIFLPPLSLQEEFAGVVARVESLRGRMSEGERQVDGLFESLLAQSFDGGR